MEITNVEKIGDMKAIRFYGGNPNLKDEEGNVIPPAKSAIKSLFEVVAEMYAYVPDQFLNDFIAMIRAKGYVYKTKAFPKYTAFALQYQKPE